MISNGDRCLMQEGHEETIIGFLMTYPNCWIDFAPLIGPELFIHPKNRLILDALGQMSAGRTEISLLSVTDFLRRSGTLEEAGGVSYLMRLAGDFHIGQAAFDYALSELRASASIRAVAEIGRRMAAGELSPKEAISALAAAELQGENGSGGLTIRSAEEILTMTLDEHDCLMGDRLLAKGQSIVMAGASGLGKSRLLLQLAVACILGRDWCGFSTHAKGLRWLILQTENSVRRLQSDLNTLQRWCGDSWHEAAESLFIHTLETDRDGILTLSDPRVAAGLESAIQKFKPDVIGFDPLRDLMIGDPNSDADMAATVATIGAISRRGNKQRAIILLHHALTGKSGAAKAAGYDRASFARNSKVLHGWTRAQINIAPGCADNNETLVLTCGKNSNGKEFAPAAVRLNPVSMIYEPDELFDLEAWRQEVSGRGKTKRIAFNPEVVKMVIVTTGADEIAKTDLVKAIQKETGCASSRAYELVDEAQKEGFIQRLRKTGKYALAE